MPHEEPEPAEPPQQGSGARWAPRWLDQWAGLTWRVLLVAAGLVAVGWLVLELRLVVVPVFVGLLGATLLVPPARWLCDRGLRPLLATWLVFLAAVALAAALVMSLGVAVVDQFDDLGSKVSEGIDDVEAWLTDGPIGLSGDELDRLEERLGDELSSGGGAAQITSGAIVLFELVTGALLAVVMAFFFVKDGEMITRWGLGQLPERHHDLARRLGRRAWSTVTAYVRGTAVVGVVDGTVIGVGLVIIGVPLAPALAVITFFAAFFPLVGAVLAGAVAALVALVDGGVTDALLVTGLVVLVQQIEGDVLAPLVMGRALRLHPLVILVALTTGAVLAGLLGAFLAVPITAVASNLLAEARLPRGSPDTA